jgi:hypothetical protein
MVAITPRLTLTSSGPPNTGDKLRSGARVHAANRRGHEAACPFWQPCRRKLRQLHPLVGPPARSRAVVDFMRSDGPCEEGRIGR